MSKYTGFMWGKFGSDIVKHMGYRDSLRTVAIDIGVSFSTLHRAINGKELKVMSILLILNWMERDISEYL